MKYTIDRFENKYAVVELENQEFVNIPRSAIPNEAKEGDIINVKIDKNQTDKQKKHIEKLMNDIWTD